MSAFRKYLLLAILIGAYATGINELNVRTIRKENPDNTFCSGRSLVHNSTVSSIDNKWYVSQIRYFLAGKGFTVDPDMYNYTVRRTPVYPLFYGLHYVLFGEAGSYYYIRFSQLLLFILATFAFYAAAKNFSGNSRIAAISAFLFASNLTLISYLYYTITEGISPALLAFLLYFFSRAYRFNRGKDWLLCGLFFALASLCRPSIFFAGPSLFLSAIFLNRQKLETVLIRLSFLVFGAGILFLPHLVRNYIVTKGDIVLLEKFYGDPMDYGPPNMALRSWISCWMNPADYPSEEISNYMKIVVCCDSSLHKEKLLDLQMRELPARATMVNSKAAIRDAYSALYDYYDAKTFRKPRLAEAEKNAMDKLTALKAEFVRKAPLQYYFVTPLLIVKSVILQSNSASIPLLDNYPGDLVKTGIKLLLYLLNIFMFLSLPFLLLKKSYRFFGLNTLLFVFLTFAYITLILKYFEARYLIPLFPFLYLSAAMALYEIYYGIRKRLHF